MSRPDGRRRPRRCSRSRASSPATRSRAGCRHAHAAAEADRARGRRRLVLASARARWSRSSASPAAARRRTAQTVIRHGRERRRLDPLPRRRDRRRSAPSELRPLRRRDADHLPGSVRVARPALPVRDTIEEPIRVHGLGDSKDGARGEGARGAGAGRADAARALHRPLSRTSSRAASASAWRSRPRSCSSRSCWSPTSRSRCSTSRCARGSWRCSTGCGKDGLGVLMITHDLSTAAHFADRIAVMYLGRIVEEGPAREVVRNPQHPYTKALISVVPRRDPRPADDAADPDGRDAEPGARAVRLPLPPALPGGRGPLQGDRPRAARRRGGGPGHRAACILLVTATGCRHRARSGEVARDRALEAPLAAERASRRAPGPSSSATSSTTTWYAVGVGAHLERRLGAHVGLGPGDAVRRHGRAPTRLPGRPSRRRRVPSYRSSTRAPNGAS